MRNIYLCVAYAKQKTVTGDKHVMNDIIKCGESQKNPQGRSSGHKGKLPFSTPSPREGSSVAIEDSTLPETGLAVLQRAS